MTVGDDVKMMSILNRKRKNEVISVRLNDERLQLLERYRKLLTEAVGPTNLPCGSSFHHSGGAG